MLPGLFRPLAVGCTAVRAGWQRIGTRLVDTRMTNPITLLFSPPEVQPPGARRRPGWRRMRSPYGVAGPLNLLDPDSSGPVLNPKGLIPRLAPVGTWSLIAGVG